MAVIDLFEMVQVQGQHGEAATGAARIGDLLVQHYREVLAVEQASQHIAAGFQFVVLLEQQIQVIADALGLLAQISQQLHGVGRVCLALAVGEQRQQHLVDPGHGFQNQLRFRCALESVRALVPEPQAELGGAQPGQMLGRGVHCHVEHQLIFPVEQSGALALFFRRHVLGYREQSVTLFGAGAAVV